MAFINFMAKEKILFWLPARGGSKRIPNKNIKNFLGKPLLAYTIEQALTCPIKGRVIVDTDSKKIAAVAKKYGAETPFLRPARLATDQARGADSLIYLLGRLKRQENYRPDYVIILQATSPLRKMEDIMACWKMIKTTGATTVLTVCPTHPRLYYLSKNNDIILVNGSEANSTNTQAWPPAYILNGCFVYIVKTKALLKERRVITKKTKAVICPKWRSVDLDNPEDWVMAEVIYKNEKTIVKKIKNFK